MDRWRKDQIVRIVDAEANGGGLRAKVLMDYPQRNGARVELIEGRSPFYPDGVILFLKDGQMEPLKEVSAD